MWLALILWVLPLQAGAQDHHLGPGDVLSLRFVGVSGGEFEIPVETDSIAWFPVIGALDVTGLDLIELRALVADAYAGTTLPGAAAAANVGAPLLDPSQVFLGVARYRPVYVDGAIAQPTLVEWRPGLTLRQALAVAGSQVPPAVGPAEAAALAARDADRIAALTADMARVEARIWRLQAMLGDVDPSDFDNAFAASPPEIRRQADLERATLAAIEAEREIALDAVAGEIALAEVRLASLLEQRAFEEEGREIDDRAVEDMRQLSERGLTTAARISDARRTALTGATRVLQLDVEIDTTRSRIARLRQEAADLRAGQVSEIREDLTEQIALRARLQAELAALRDAIRVAGASGATMSGEPRSVRILRATADPIQVGADDAAFVLMPGDVLEIMPPTGTDGT